ncbi:MAG: cytidine deaminase [Acidobacteria bacterium]|nr:cytidine deaminase [Acidobacteriota bacterium]MCI0717813.1 cytidine deaminase [Acidobacteriota bacterium]
MKKPGQVLVDAARRAREQARAKYSRFKVGSALLCSDGRVFTGCNIESSSYGLTICSERVALFKALSEGASSFSRIVVVADTDELTSPCGACRQLLWDFCGDIEIVLTNLAGKSKTAHLAQLFPEPFGDHLFH